MKITLELPDNTKIITITTARFSFPNMCVDAYNISSHTVDDGDTITLTPVKEDSE